MRSLLAASVYLCSASAMAADAVGWASVPAGDILTVNGEAYRLFGIDAVEPRQTCYVDGRPWACGPAAIRALEILVGPEPVVCTPTPEASPTELGVFARCTVGGRDIAEAQVRAGMAIADRDQSSEYVASEDAARSEKAGVWRSSFVEPRMLRADIAAIETRVLDDLRRTAGSPVAEALTEEGGGIPIFTGYRISRGGTGGAERSYSIPQMAPGFILSQDGDLFTWQSPADAVSRWREGLVAVTRADAAAAVWESLQSLPRKVVSAANPDDYLAVIREQAAPILAAGRRPVLVLGEYDSPSWMEGWINGQPPAGVVMAARDGAAPGRYVTTLDGIDIYVGTVADGESYLFAGDILDEVRYPDVGGGVAETVAEPGFGANPARITVRYAQSVAWKSEPVVVVKFPFTAERILRDRS